MLDPARRPDGTTRPWTSCVSRMPPRPGIYPIGQSSILPPGTKTAHKEHPVSCSALSAGSKALLLTRQRRSTGGGMAMRVRERETHMKKQQDAFGQMVMDYYKHGVGHEIVEREDGFFYVTSGGPACYLAAYQDWPSLDRKALRYVRGRVLDVGCGAGRCALYLQREEHEVLALDYSPLAIEVCRLRGVKHTKLASITQFTAPSGAFDTILMMGNNFGLLGNFKRARWLLRRFSTMTGTHGRIIAESLDPFQPYVLTPPAYRRLNRQRGRMPGQVRIRLHHRNYHTPWFDYLMVSKREMKRILTGTGWEITRFIETTPPLYVAVIDKTS
jgi:SAM-dependent methyltransferase